MTPLDTLGSRLHPGSLSEWSESIGHFSDLGGSADVGSPTQLPGDLHFWGGGPADLASGKKHVKTRQQKGLGQENVPSSKHGCQAGFPVRNESHRSQHWKMWRIYLFVGKGSIHGSSFETEIKKPFELRIRTCRQFQLGRILGVDDTSKCRSHARIVNFPATWQMICGNKAWRFLQDPTWSPSPCSRLPAICRSEPSCPPQPFRTSRWRWKTRPDDERMDRGAIYSPLSFWVYVKWCERKADIFQTLRNFASGVWLPCSTP